METEVNGSSLRFVFNFAVNLKPLEKIKFIFFKRYIR